MTFDRYLRFRYLSPRGSADGAFVILRDQGVLKTYFEQEHQDTFASLLHPMDGDLLEIEYPAAYGYFLFGPKGDGKWKYTTKSI